MFTLFLAKLCKSHTGPPPQCSYRVTGRSGAGDSLWISTPLRFVLFTSQKQFFFHVFQITWLTATGGLFLLWKSLHPSVPVMHLVTSAHARLTTNNCSALEICWHHRFNQVHFIFETFGSLGFLFVVLVVCWPVIHKEHICLFSIFSWPFRTCVLHNEFPGYAWIRWSCMLRHVTREKKKKKITSPLGHYFIKKKNLQWTYNVYSSRTIYVIKPPLNFNR